MVASAAQNDWVQKVLGINVPELASVAPFSEGVPALAADLRAAEARARAQLDTFKSRLLADQEVLQDSEFEHMQAVLRDAGELIPLFDNSILDALDDLEAAGDNARREAARARALELLSEYDAELQYSEILTELENLSNEWYGIVFQSSLRKDIGALRQTLEQTH
jgi:hypothetical protein